MERGGRIWVERGIVKTIWGAWVIDCNSSSGQGNIRIIEEGCWKDVKRRKHLNWGYGVLQLLGMAKF